MTTAIAIEGEHETIIGCDSQTTAGNEVWRTNSKVFVNGGVTFAMAGPVRNAQVIQHATIPDLDTWDVDRWVTNALIPALMDALQHVGLMPDPAKGHGGQLLAVVTGRVYKVHTDMGWVRRPNGIYAIGSGADYALGALAAGADVHTALEVAASFDPSTSAPMLTATIARDTNELVPLPRPTLIGAPA